jgi:hypothetical protein
MRRRHGLAFANQPLEESEEERQVKRSVELLRIKELTLPTTIERSSSDLLVTEIVAPTVVQEPMLSPPLPDTERARKTQSAYTPIATTGLWDSGVTGVKSRPTSMSVLNRKKAKEERKRERKERKDDEKEKRYEDKDSVEAKKQGEWSRLKLSLKGLFRRARD